jgi:putative ABC transport system substrate-binding protein
MGEVSVLDMRRREFIAALGGAAAWPIAARAQQDGRARRVGVLMTYDEADRAAQARLRSFWQGLADLGWIDGRNVHIDVRWAGTDAARQQSDARELVATMPDVILVTNTPATQALRNATRTIPIVFVGLSDPVANGLLLNLARPEANITGFTAFENSMAGKWLSLLKDISPGLARVALLFNPSTAPYSQLYVPTAQDAAERLAIKVTPAHFRDASGIEPAVAAMAGSGGGLLVLPDISNTLNSATTTALAAKYRVPAIYYNRFFAADGGLMSYGADQARQYRDGATYVDRILRGTRPAELSVQFATKFELVINLKTAKTLGLEVPPTLLASVDEVIE